MTDTRMAATAGWLTKRYAESRKASQKRCNCRQNFLQEEQFALEAWHEAQPIWRVITIERCLAFDQVEDATPGDSGAV